MFLFSIILIFLYHFRFQDEELDLNLDNLDNNDEEIRSDDEDKGITLKNDLTNDAATTILPSMELKVDIMAQQLKFIACLKIIMEELSTLASGYEVDGGHLRAQLYFWLEKEVEVLRQLCDYNVNLDENLFMAEENSTAADSGGVFDDERPRSPSLFHEALRNDRANMTARFCCEIKGLNAITTQMP